MATSNDFMQYVTAQFENTGEVTAKYMFGEFGVYSDGKLFALLCDNQLFIKPTEEGRYFIGTSNEAPPYPGAKNSFLITDRLEDKDWLNELARITLKALPEPKPKKKKMK
ncbi:MAG: TfoX/Sxy family protein [Flavobacteriales bacterium]|nr:TfoX/Sxy family protein [Bacteroidota bacterium]NCQ58744.1 TfoX/Sxy family protein [Flavobacteriales bacterium]